MRCRVQEIIDETVSQELPVVESLKFKVYSYVENKKHFEIGQTENENNLADIDEGYIEERDRNRTQSNYSSSSDYSTTEFNNITPSLNTITDIDKQHGYISNTNDSNNIKPTISNNNNSNSNSNSSSVNSTTSIISRSLSKDEPDDNDIIKLINNIVKLSPNQIVIYLSYLNGDHPGFKRQFQDQLYSILQQHNNINLSRSKQLLPSFLNNNNINSNKDNKDHNIDNDNPDWNGRFQMLIEQLRQFEGNSTERLRIYGDLSKLANDFYHCSLTYGKLIISEVYVPIHKKTIKPQKYISGILGGEKYLIKNILFKFATAESKHGLFNSTTVAAKVAGHDLKGLMLYFNLGIDLLHFPLMVLVDYLGFRLQALSWLPINKHTIIYGTPDAGKHMYAENTKFNKRMKLCGEKLNIKPHMCGLTENTSKLLSSCADLEGHLCPDGRFYLLDFSRALPPFSTSTVFQLTNHNNHNNKDININNDTTIHKNSHLFRLFRPEFVKGYSKQLCPDTYSGFVANHNAKEHIEEVKEATIYLIKTTIPKYANYINNNEINIEINRIKQLMHKQGINLYFMGILRSHLNNPQNKKQILIEIISRTIKHSINDRLRFKMEELKLSLQRPLIAVIVDYLNLLFGNSLESNTYWNSEIKKSISDQYPMSLSDDELLSIFNLKSYISENDGFCLLFISLIRSTSIKFTTQAYLEFSTNPMSFQFERPIDETDIEELSAKSKHIGLIDTSMGFYLKDKAMMKTGENSTRLFEAAIEKFTEALLSNGEDKLALREMAHIYSVIGNTTNAHNYYKESIAVDPTDSVTIYQYALFLDSIQHVELSDQYYLRSLELKPDDVLVLKLYGDFLTRNGHKEEASKFFYLAKTYSKASSVKEEIIYENERRSMFSNLFGKSNLLITDTRGGWSNKKDIPMELEDVQLPTSEWEWFDNWKIDSTKPHLCDNEGWSYSFNWNGEWHNKPNPLTYVRRRRWKRTRRRKQLDDRLQLSFSEVYSIPRKYVFFIHKYY